MIGEKPSSWACKTCGEVYGADGYYWRNGFRNSKDCRECYTKRSNAITLAKRAETRGKTEMGRRKQAELRRKGATPEMRLRQMGAFNRGREWFRLEVK